MLTRICVVAAVTILGASGITSASNIYFEQDFESLTPGTINGQAGWTSTATAEVQSTVANPGQAVQMNNASTATRLGIFGSTHAKQRLQFDIMVPFTINEVPFEYSADIQHEVLLRGPNVNQQMFFVYKGGKNENQAAPSAPSPFNCFSFRGAATQNSTFAPQAGVWYTVVIDFDFAASTFDGKIYQGSTLLWDPLGNQNFINNGNTNYFGLTADGTYDFSFVGVGDLANLEFNVDNIVVYIPEPAAALVAAPLGMLLLRRPRV
jgi:hypothetical protein